MAVHRLVTYIYIYIYIYGFIAHLYDTLIHFFWGGWVGGVVLQGHIAPIGESYKWSGASKLILENMEKSRVHTVWIYSICFRNANAWNAYALGMLMSIRKYVTHVLSPWRVNLFEADSHDGICGPYCQILYHYGRLHIIIRVFLTLWAVWDRYDLDSV